MGINYNSKIVTDGLVCYLDPANPKSYSPNVQPYSTDLYSWFTGGYQYTVTRDTIASPVGNTPVKVVINGAYGYSSTYNSSAWNLAPAANGDVWTTSIWIKASTPTTGTFLIFECNSSGNYTTYGQGGYNVTTEWTRVTFTYTMTQATTAYVQTRFDLNGNGITVWVDGWQTERAPAMTPFNPVKNTTYTIYDLSGNGNNGTLSAGELYGTASNLYFRNYKNISGVLTVNVPDSASLTSAFNATKGGWTIEEAVWTNSTTYPEADAGSVVSSDGRATGFDWNHGMGTGNFQFGQNSGGGAGTYADTVNITIPAQYTSFNIWKLRTLVWDRGNNTNYLYINGVLVGSGSTPSTSGKVLYDGGGITLGALYGWKHYGRRGATRIYDRVLSSTEILQNYNSVKGKYV